MKQTSIGIFFFSAFAFLAFSPLDSREAENFPEEAQQQHYALTMTLQAQYGGTGSTGTYSYEKAKTPEELRLEYLKLARNYEKRAEKQSEKGQKKADKYRAEAAEIMGQAETKAEANPDEAERILAKASQKAERLEKKAEEALNKSKVKAEKYTAKAKEYYQKAEAI